jgi:hypothetical protein
MGYKIATVMIDDDVQNVTNSGTEPGTGKALVIVEYIQVPANE